MYSDEIIAIKLRHCTRVENKELNTIDFLGRENVQSKRDKKRKVPFVPVRQVVFRTCRLEREKVILQIGASTVEGALEAATLVHKDVAGVDLNMGVRGMESVLDWLVDGPLIGCDGSSRLRVCLYMLIQRRLAVIAMIFFNSAF